MILTLVNIQENSQTVYLLQLAIETVERIEEETPVLVI
jgi:uncharacterized protein (UPF0335 family)